MEITSRLVGSLAADSTGWHLDGERREALNTRIDRVLAEPSDESLIQDLVDVVADLISRSPSQEAEIVATLPFGLQMIWTTWDVEGQVNNGGFNQYYFNRRGPFAPRAREGYEAIGAPDHAAIVQRSIDLFTEKGYILNRLWGKRSLAEFAASYKNEELREFHELDEQFYRLNEDVDSLRAAHVRLQPKSVLFH